MSGRPYTSSMGEWGFFGREPELQKIGQRLRDESARGVVISGPAGVGKTRLAAEALRRAERAHFVTERVMGTRAAAGLPFGALAPLLPHGRDDGTGAVDDPADLLRQSVRALVERAGDRRLCLLVDDAHLLDAASATLLHHLVATTRSFVLVTVRTNEPAPDPVVSLWKDDLLERLDLRGLSAEAIEALVKSVLGGSIDGATLASLLIRCQGNVLFLRELILGAITDGTLQEDRGLWRLIGPLAPSHRLVELVEARLADLIPDERSVLEIASFGEPLSPTELTAVADAEVVESLERKGLLASERDGRRLQIRLAHPLYGDVLRLRIPSVRLRLICRSLAELTEATGARRREDILRIGTWRLEGGGGRPNLMLQAAYIARWRYDLPLAERLANAARDAGMGFDAALLGARLASHQGRAGEAEAILAGLAERAVDDRQRALVATARLDNHAFFVGRTDEALSVAEEAEASIADPAWRDEVRARRCGILFIVKGPAAGAQAAQPLLERDGGRAFVWTAITAEYCFIRLGRFSDAVVTAERAYAAQLELTSPLDWYPWYHLYFRGLALCSAGRIAEGQRIADGQYDEAVRDQSVEGQAWFALLRSQIAAERGHLESAARHAQEAVSLYRRLGRPVFLHLSLCILAVALAQKGSATDAEEVLREVDELGPLPAMHIAADLLQARAWVAAAQGNLPRARSLLDEAITGARHIGDRLGAAMAVHAYARLGGAANVVSETESEASEIEGELAAARRLRPCFSGL